MRRSIKRAGYLVAAVLLALVGVVTATGTASAARESTRMGATAAPVQSCPFPSGCVLDAINVPANSQVLTFCVSDIYNVVYSIQEGRGGFINRSLLREPDEQTEGCKGSGGIGTVGDDTHLSSCSGPCVDFGEVDPGEQVDVFCELEGSFLVYLDSKRLAGFLETHLVAVIGDVDDC